MKLSKKQRNTIYSSLPDNDTELQSRLMIAQAKLNSILDEYGQHLQNLQTKSTKKLLDIKPGRRAIRNLYTFYSEQNGVLDAIRRRDYKEVTTLAQEDHLIIQNAIAKSLALLPELKALVANPIFSEKNIVGGRILSKHDLAAKEKLITILEDNLKSLNCDGPEQLQYSVWQLGYDTNYGYRANPFTILGKLLLGIFFCCTILGLGIGYDTLKSIKYEDTWLSTPSPGSTGEVATPYLGEFDLLFEDLSVLFSSKGAINETMKRVEPEQADENHANTNDLTT